MCEKYRVSFIFFFFSLEKKTVEKNPKPHLTNTYKATKKMQSLVQVQRAILHTINQDITAAGAATVKNDVSNVIEIEPDERMDPNVIPPAIPVIKRSGKYGT